MRPLLSLFLSRTSAFFPLAALCCIASAQAGATPPTPATTPSAEQKSTGLKVDSTSGTVPGYVMTTPPKIDGVLDADEWKDVPEFEGLVDASNGGPVPYQGQFWLAYDTKYIYFAAKLPDDKPKEIKATEYRTNVSLSGNDDVAIIVDPFGTLTDFNVFQINPRGATNARIVGGRAAKREWVGEIEAKSRITDTGWETEVRIPWSIMKLPPSGPRDVRFNVYRYSPKYGRDTSWKLIDNGHSQDTPHWTNVTVPPGPPKVLQFLPYNYSGYAPDGAVSNMGLDLKTGLTDDLDFAGTLNPDFRNIENQVLSLDFSYFERLAGESRPFFLEGGNYFHTSNDAPIFTSQRINGFDAGEKVYGKIGPKTDLAVLNTSDFTHQNNLVFDAFNQISTHTSFRAAFADMNRPELKNDAYHWEYRSDRGPWTAYYQNAGTTDSDSGRGVRHNPGIAYSNGNYGGYFEYSSVTQNFNPRLGFAPQTGFHGLGGDMNLGHNLLHGPIQQENYNVFWKGWDKFDGGGTYLHELTFSTDHALRSGTDIGFSYDATEFDGFKDHVVGIGITRPWNDNYRKWSVNYNTGQVEGTDYKSSGLNFQYRPTEMMQIVSSYQVVNHLGTHQQAIVSANYDLGSDRSISGRAIMRDSDWNAYVAYRRSGNAGMEYFLILGDPNAPKWRSSLILKVTFPLQMFLGKH
jgi:hypothetical protein